MEQRAYVAVNPGGVKMIESPPDKAIADVLIENVGRLPARDVRWAFWYEFTEDCRKKYFEIDSSKAEGGNTLPPGGTMTQGSQQFSGAELDLSPQIETHDPDLPKMYLYVWGVVLYEDGFHKLRSTEFCHRYNCINFDHTLRGITKDFGRFHRYGNKAN